MNNAIEDSIRAMSKITDGLLDKLRKAGWSVAIHNDYILLGRKMTFWLFTHENGTYLRGEDATDIEALTSVCSRAFPEAPVSKEKDEAPSRTQNLCDFCGGVFPPSEEGEESGPPENFWACNACSPTKSAAKKLGFRVVGRSGPGVDFKLTIWRRRPGGMVVDGRAGDYRPDTNAWHRGDYDILALEPVEPLAPVAPRGGYEAFEDPVTGERLYRPAVVPTKTCEPWCGKDKRAPKGALAWNHSGRGDPDFCSTECLDAGRSLHPAAPPVEAKPGGGKGEAANISITKTVRPMIFDSRLPSGMVVEAKPDEPTPANLCECGHGPQNHLTNGQCAVASCSCKEWRPTHPRSPDGYTLGPGWEHQNHPNGWICSRCPMGTIKNVSFLYTDPEIPVATTRGYCHRHAVEMKALVPTEVRVEPATSAEPAKGLAPRMRTILQEIDLGSDTAAVRLGNISVLACLCGMVNEVAALEADRDTWKASHDDIESLCKANERDHFKMEGAFQDEAASLRAQLKEAKEGRDFYEKQFNHERAELTKIAAQRDQAYIDLSNIGTMVDKLIKKIDRKKKD